MLYAIDTETYLIGRRLTPRFVVASVCNERGQTRLMDSAAFIEWFTKKLASGNHFVGHNIAYDLAVIMVEADSLVEPIFEALSANRISDTFIRERLIQIALGIEEKTSLSAVVQRRFGHQMGGKDSTRLEYSALDGVPIKEWPQEFVRYAEEDALWTYKVYKDQESEDAVTNAGRPIVPLHDEHMQVRAAVALHLCAVWGMATDKDAVDAFCQRVEAQVAEGLQIAQEMGFIRPNGSKNLTRMRELLELAYQKRTMPLTPSGKISTSKEALENSKHEGLMGYAKSLNAQKLLSTYVPILRQESIHPRYNVLVATGRTSCRKPNMQNPPREGGFRECFKSREGYYYVSADYSQIEALTLAQLCLNYFGKSELAKALQNGKDIHLWFGAKLGGMSYEEIETAYKAGNKNAKNLRQRAKGVNYGLPGGLGPASLAEYLKGYGLDVSTDQARRYRNMWLETWPEMVLYFERAGKLTQFSPATIVHEYSERQRGNCGFTQACNTPFQGLAADGAKCALWEVAKECYTGNSVLRTSRPVLFLHDEIMLESPYDHAEAAAARLSEIMVQQMRRFIPDIPVEAEPKISDVWSK